MLLHLFIALSAMADKHDSNVESPFPCVHKKSTDYKSPSCSGPKEILRLPIIRKLVRQSSCANQRNEATQSQQGIAHLAHKDKKRFETIGDNRKGEQVKHLQKNALEQQLQERQSIKELRRVVSASMGQSASLQLKTNPLTSRKKEMASREKTDVTVPLDRDFARWKKCHGLKKHQKVFCVSGCYPIIRQELEKRDWFQNVDKASLFFDLKWCLKSEDIKGVKLQKYQRVNHFMQNTALTTKIGLLRSLKQLIWHQSINASTFFPQAFDLNDPQEMIAFVQYFRYVKAEGVMKNLVKYLISDPQVLVNHGLVYVLMTIARKQLRSRHAEEPSEGISLEDSIDASIDSDLVSDLQWSVLMQITLDDFSYFTSDHAPIEVNLNDKENPKILGKRFYESLKHEIEQMNDLLSINATLLDSVREEFIRLVLALEKACPQFYLNGGGVFSDHQSVSRNAWIVKPAGMSRGRGIQVFDCLPELLKHIDVDNHKECQWIAQKYIENPLLICRRKFDIRQWVLVTAWNPLTIWMHRDFYLRFSSEEFEMNDLSNVYVHLTNNSIQKCSEKFSDVYSTDDGEMQVEGNMWHSDQLEQYVLNKMGEEYINWDLESIWKVRIREGIKKIIVYSLECVQDTIEHRNNSFELYGYDFMLDRSLYPWLIEVNSSPACDYSTATAQRYVEAGLADIIKVVVDFEEYEQKRRHQLLDGAKEPPTGCWERIHRANFVGKAVSSFGSEFQVMGKKIIRKKKRKRKVSRDEAVSHCIGGDESSACLNNQLDHSYTSELKLDENDGLGELSSSLQGATISANGHKASEGILHSLMAHRVLNEDDRMLL